MRTLVLVLITLALAWGVWHVMGDDDLLPPSDSSDEVEPREGPDPRVTASDERAYGTGSMPTTTALEVTVTSASSHVPEGAQVGYVYGGRERLRPAGERGKVLFTDAPLGEVEIVARAPGFERASQRHYLNAGLRTDVHLVLKLKEGFKPREAPTKDR